MSNINQIFRLPNGRKLGYDEYGLPNGKPLFYFHGSPSSRVEATLYVNEELLNSFEVRMIALDRPGLGLSDFQPNRRILDWSQDVVALANHLNIDRFSILAYSLGGPYGLACAFSVPQRLHKVGIVSGAALFTDPELVKNINEGTRRFLTMPREKPMLSRLFLWMMLSFMPRVAPNRFIAQANSLLPEPDRLIVANDPAFQMGFLHMLQEAMKRGTRGAHYESLLSITDWGFRLREINIPIQLWHGDADQNIPVEMARFAETVIPRCEAKIYPNEGHLSLFKKNAKEIISTLTN